MKPLQNNLRLADWSFWTSIGFIAILVSLHFIKPETEPSWNFISEYEVGRFGWLMQLAFLSLALSCIFLAGLLWKRLNVIGKIGVVMLMISATGMIIAAIFKTDPLNTPAELVTRSGKLHQLGAMLDQVPFATLFISISLWRKKEWDINRLLIILASLLVWFGFIYFIGSIKSQFPADGKFGPNVLVGWQNRIMIITQAAWLATIARQVNRQLNSKTIGKQQRTADLVSYGAVMVIILLVY